MAAVVASTGTGLPAGNFRISSNSNSLGQVAMEPSYVATCTRAKERQANSSEASKNCFSHSLRSSLTQESNFLFT